MTRDNDGKFVKGSVGNKKGRPKIIRLTDEDRAKLVAIVNENVKEPNLLSKMLIFMLEKAGTLADVHKYLKEYAPFLIPKLSAVKQEIESNSTITFVVEGLATVEFKNPAENKVIEGEIVPEIEDARVLSEEEKVAVDNNDLDF